MAFEKGTVAGLIVLAFSRWLLQKKFQKLNKTEGQPQSGSWRKKWDGQMSSGRKKMIRGVNGWVAVLRQTGWTVGVVCFFKVTSFFVCISGRDATVSFKTFGHARMDPQLNELGTVIGLESAATGLGRAERSLKGSSMSRPSWESKGCRFKEQESKDS